MRIAVVGTRGIPGLPGGVERHCEELYPRLVALGDEVTLYAREAYLPEEREYKGVRVVPVASPTGRSTETIVHTARAIRATAAEKPDVLHVHSIGPGGLVPLAGLLGMKTVLTVHAFDYLQTKWGAFAKAYLRWGERTGVRGAQGAIAVARWMADALVARYARQVDYIPNGPLTVAPVAAGSTLRELGVEAGRYALFVGRLIPDKRVEDLVAASVLGKPVPVVVVGDTSHTDSHADSLRRGAPGNVVFAGARGGDELGELYSNAGVFALPSAAEGLPMSLLEAMSAGLPCVASDIPANREVLADAGALVPLGDAAALRAAIDDALSMDATRREEVSEVAKGRIREEYDWDRIAQRTREVLLRAAGGTG